MAAADETRRAEILDAAGAVFLEKGFEAATTLEIARRAHMSKRDLYRLFDSKQGLLDELVATHSERMALTPDLGVPSDRATFLETLRGFGRRFLGEYLDPRRVGLYRLAIAEAPRSTRLGEAMQANGVEPVRRSMIDFATQAVAHGILAAEDAEMVMETFADALVGALHLRMLQGLDGPPDEATLAARADRAVEVVARLIAKGR